VLAAQSRKEKIMKKKIINAVCAATLLISMVAANAATQVGITYNYTGTANSASGNDNEVIAQYLDTDHWTIPTENTRGVMTGQNTKDAEGNNDGNFDKCFTGSKNAYIFANGIAGAKLVYYTFDFMGSASGRGSFAINEHRLDGKSYDNSDGVAVEGVDICKTNYRAYHPYKITVIADTLNQKAYYYSVEPETSTVESVVRALENEAIQISLGNKPGTNNRYFFKNFEYGTLDYAITGADVIAAGCSEVYSISEAGTADDNVNFVPENLTLTCDAEGVTITDNATVLVDADVAENTVITLSANINGTVVATKDITVSTSSDEPQIQDTTVYDSTEDEIAFVAEFTADSDVTELTWYLKKADGEYKALPVDGVLPTIASGSTVKIGLLVTGFADIASADELSAGYIVE